MGSSTLGFFVTSAVIGATVMAVIQILRGLIPVRGLFHRHRLEQWLGRNQPSMAELEGLLARQGKSSPGLAAYDLPLELLVGQISAIAEGLIDANALRHKGQSDAGSPPPGLLEALTHGNEKGSESSPHGPAYDESNENRARLALAVQRNLDRFQIETAALWRRRLVVSAVLLSMSLFVIGAATVDTAGFVRPSANEVGVFLQYLGAMLFVGLLGGFIASVARDLVAVVERLRR